MRPTLPGNAVSSHPPVLAGGCFRLHVDTVARIPGPCIMPPSRCEGSKSSRLGPGPDALVAGPAPVGPRSNDASAPGRPSSASPGNDGSHAPPRSTSLPATPHPGTPKPSLAPVRTASSGPFAAGRTSAIATADAPVWPAPWPSDKADRTGGIPLPSAHAGCEAVADRG